MEQTETILEAFDGCLVVVVFHLDLYCSKNLLSPFTESKIFPGDLRFYKKGKTPVCTRLTKIVPNRNTIGFRKKILPPYYQALREDILLNFKNFFKDDE